MIHLYWFVFISILQSSFELRAATPTTATTSTASKSTTTTLTVSTCTASTSTATTSTSTLATMSTLKPKQKKLERFLDNVKPVENEKLNTLAANFFFGCNIPFQVADSIHFKNFVKALRPAYNPPHRHQLAGKLLDQTYDKMEKRNLEMINQMDKKVTLLVDGWQNSAANRHCVVTMLSTSDDKKIFLESYNFSSIRETGQNLHEAVQKSIVLAKERYDADVYAILTDNAYNMQNMVATAQSTADLLYSTCNSHSANLLAGDVLKTSEYSKNMDKVMAVQKEYKKTSLEDRLLKMGGHKPKLSCPTRWTSQRNAVDSFLKNLTAMKTVTGKQLFYLIS